MAPLLSDWFYGFTFHIEGRKKGKGKERKVPWLYFNTERSKPLKPNLPQLKVTHSMSITHTCIPTYIHKMTHRLPGSLHFFLVFNMPVHLSLC